MAREDTYYTVPISRRVRIGNLELGAGLHVVVQSMANTDTSDVPASVAQLKKIAAAGGALVRFTTQGKKEVAALDKIVRSLEPPFDQIPVAADVHFRADVAFEAARICQKVRINPGNFTERKGGPQVYNEELFHEGILENRRPLKKLLAICREHHTALRIGVNHGSLSSRIMSKYGDTPEGMVESAMEFLRVCSEESFEEVVVSLKSSNTVLMVQAVRLMVKQMLEENLYFPLHLGITESGDGAEGRIKSAAGMAPLLMEGIGDTLRVSLTEPPEHEIPVAQMITSMFPKPATLPYHPLEDLPWDPFHHDVRQVRQVHGIGEHSPVAVIAKEGAHADPEPDFIVQENNNAYELKANNSWIPDAADAWRIESATVPGEKPASFLLSDPGMDPVKMAHRSDPAVIILDGTWFEMTTVKEWLIRYYRAGGSLPVFFRKKYMDQSEDTYQIKAAGELSLLLIDRLIHGVWIENPYFPSTFNNALSFRILQATRNRITSTEYIACPSCGRTLFDIQSVLAKVRKRTNHLKGLRLAVMGCIVNGPGEMADADYGYVGAGKGKVSVYKGRTAVRKNIPEEQAVDELISVIQENGDWIDP